MPLGCRPPDGAAFGVQRIVTIRERRTDHEDADAFDE